MPPSDPWDFDESNDRSPQVRPIDLDAPGPAAAFDQLGWESDRTLAGAPLAVAVPPVRWLGISVLVALVSAGLALAFGAAVPGLAISGWVLSGPLAIGLLAYFTVLDTRERTKATYIAPTWVRAGYWVCVVVSLAAVLVCALRIAFWVGRL